MHENPIDKSVHDIATSKTFKTVKSIWLWMIAAPIILGLVIAIFFACVVLVFLFLISKTVGM
jgi:uncharacterized membrane protein